MYVCMYVCIHVCVCVCVCVYLYIGHASGVLHDDQSVQGIR
jgi:hypothetical protein